MYESLNSRRGGVLQAPGQSSPGRQAARREARRPSRSRPVMPLRRRSSGTTVLEAAGTGGQRPPGWLARQPARGTGPALPVLQAPADPGHRTPPRAADLLCAGSAGAPAVKPLQRLSSLYDAVYEAPRHTMSGRRRAELALCELARHKAPRAHARTHAHTHTIISPPVSNRLKPSKDPGGASGFRAARGQRSQRNLTHSHNHQPACRAMIPAEPPDRT